MQVYYSQDIREEELKNKVSQDWFNSFDTTQIVGYIDFCVCANVGAIRPVPPFEKNKKTAPPLDGGKKAVPPLDGDKETVSPFERDNKVSPFERDNKVPPFEGVGGVSQDAGGSPPITGNESVSLSKSRSTWDAGGSPAERRTKWDPSNDKASVTLPAKKTGKIPNELYDILSNPDKRKKLIIYINPPYAEAGNRKTASGTGTPTTGVSVHQLTYKKFVKEIGLAGRELFAQFFIRIYKEIPGCTLAEFC